VTIAGWIFLGVAWSVVIGLAAFCIVKTIRQD
jgi:hypothetical protein